MSSLKDNGSTSQWRKLRARILMRDQGICQNCGLDGDTVDHIIPRRLGGSDEDFNLQCLCRKCNFSKGGRFFNDAKTPLTLPVSYIPENDSRSFENE